MASLYSSKEVYLLYALQMVVRGLAVPDVSSHISESKRPGGRGEGLGGLGS